MVSFSLKELEKSHDVNIRWRSYELRPQGSPPIPEWYLARIEEARPKFAARMLDEHGVQIESGPFGVNSRPALRGAKFAEAHDKGEAYHEALFVAYWQQAADIAETVVLADIAESVGLDRTAFVVALDNAALETAVRADVDQAFQYGLSGVPALVFGGKYLVSGAQPLAVLQQIADRVSSEESL